MTAAKPHSKTAVKQGVLQRWCQQVSGQTLFLASMLVLAVGVFGYIGLTETFGWPEATAAKSKLEEIPFDGKAAYDYLKQLCDFGPRPSGSQAMVAQQKFLIDYFQKLGATVTRQ